MRALPERAFKGTKKGRGEHVAKRGGNRVDTCVYGKVSQRRLLSTNIVLHFGSKDPPKYATPYLELERAVFPLTAGMDPERRGVFSEQGYPSLPHPFDQGTELCTQELLRCSRAGGCSIPEWEMGRLSQVLIRATFHPTPSDKRDREFQNFRTNLDLDSTPHPQPPPQQRMEIEGTHIQEVLTKRPIYWFMDSDQNTPSPILFLLTFSSTSLSLHFSSPLGSKEHHVGFPPTPPTPPSAASFIPPWPPGQGHSPLSSVCPLIS
ncbi:hypothetical protein CEXT_821 [Caerostris extrusa]|uniref:Uncharacterized protein n=1 Tax=Caerostris extrusa TaxID=172846 RepID=A0AAV4SF21_CAEEX|nr:hypothetical protein CEXT_821 [Caerostris extrusa]